ncbi:hypothetical protein CMALT394_40059 [Carnobacterium maltaromaticum]|nr:hypothetical protein CMALT394_40059 [Carnobacterium maltaromaticum]
MYQVFLDGITILGLLKQTGLVNFFIILVLMNQLLEKKMEIRDGKKRHINFPYFLIGATRLNKLFIKASSYEPDLRKKDEFPKK